MIDRKIFEDRLTFKETTITGHTAVSRLVARFNAFVNAAVATGGVGGGGEGGREVALEQYDALVKELMLMRLEVREGRREEMVWVWGGCRGWGLGICVAARIKRRKTRMHNPSSLPPSLPPPID